MKDLNKINEEINKINEEINRLERELYFWDGFGRGALIMGAVSIIVIAVLS